MIWWKRFDLWAFILLRARQHNMYKKYLKWKLNDEKLGCQWTDMFWWQIDKKTMKPEWEELWWRTKTAFRHEMVIGVEAAHHKSTSLGQTPGLKGSKVSYQVCFMQHSYTHTFRCVFGCSWTTFHLHEPASCVIRLRLRNITMHQTQLHTHVMNT